MVYRVLELMLIASVLPSADTGVYMEDLCFVLFMALVAWIAYKILNDTGGGGTRERMPIRA